jgi:hypothetical protein
MLDILLEMALLRQWNNSMERTIPFCSQSARSYVRAQMSINKSDIAELTALLLAT